MKTHRPIAIPAAFAAFMLLLGGLGAGSLPASAVTAASLYVTTTGSGTTCSQASPCGTIQNAINTAESGSYNGNNVTINVAAGTYTENDSISASSLNSLIIAGAGASSTTVNGGAAGSVFIVNNGNATISGLTITNGHAQAGVGINNGGTLTVEDSTISDNAGGGINNGGTLTVEDSTISDNAGGGIDNSGYLSLLTVKDSNISDNSNGGILNYHLNPIPEDAGTITLADSTVSNNSGYGVENSASGTLTVRNSAISANTGDGIITGINAYTPDGSYSSLTVKGSTISGNSGTTGGGIWVLGPASVTIADSTISGNTASQGGGIFNTGIMTVEDSTITGNTATQGGGGGGIYNTSGSDYFGSVSLAADIIAKQSAGADCVSVAGFTGITDTGYNIDDDGSCGLSPSNHSVSDSTVIDAHLGALGNYGGPTQTILPLAGSPAIGAIPTGTTLNGISVCPRTDQRGVASVGNCTIGAVEVRTDTVAFNSSGGAAVSSMSGPDGSSITLPSDSYPGHTFDGWFTASSGGTKVGGAGSSYTIPPGGSTLYAHWTAIRPAITKISPTSGPPAGGTKVTITGSGFTGATKVVFGGVAARSFTVVSSTKITAVSPAHAASTLNIHVTSPGGTSAQTAADQFRYT
jgi:uncharacterized repeat protein (TIGR02543 family)